MRRSAVLNPLRPGIGIALLAAALTALLVPGLAAAKTAKPVARQAPNATLEQTVLTNLKGHTLYSLSAETNGRFICTGSCLATWHPLVVAADVKPTGPVRLGTIVRPDGRTQVTYKGRPLYSFAGDAKSGDVNGEGIKDVGTWHAAVTGRVAPAPQPQPQPQPEPVYPY